MKGSAESASSFERPEIDRYELRKMLLDSLLPDTVQWNRHLRKVEEVDGQIFLHFDHGVETSFDLVVGADGAWSKVRSFLTDVKPEYYGIGGFQFVLPDTAERYSKISKLVNRGSLFSFSDGKSIIAQQLGTGGISCAAWYQQPESWQSTAEYDIHDPEAVQSKLQKVFADCDPILKGIINEIAISEVYPMSLYALPIGKIWQHNPKVTLIGDAAHLCAPFSGEGVNMAMKDAMDLAETIVKSLDQDAGEISTEIKQFESQMLKRNTRVQQTSYDMGRAVMFEKGQGGIEFNIQQWISLAAADELSPIMRFFVRSLVSLFYFFFRLFGLGTGLEKSLES
jgi:2-polyprenyl-6-methoxyphenol hydroxylase-like FAD-dependent oxidoreductase